MRGRERRERFDKFTERARKALALAHEEGARFNHNYIGTEHLLLGLVREGDGVAARALEARGVLLSEARQRVEQRAPLGSRPPQGEIGLTPRARRAVELAFDEARRQNHHYIGTEHLLLGLLREGEGTAAEVLADLGADPEGLRASVLEVINAGGFARSRPGWLLDRLRRRPAPGPTDAAPALPDPETFSGEGRRTLEAARAEARRLRHNYLGTEHLLLGLVARRDTIAARQLARWGVGPEKTRASVEFIIGRGDGPAADELHPTPRARHVLQLARAEAQELGAPLVGPEHILLGLMREGESIAASVMASMGVNTDVLRRRLLLAMAPAYDATALSILELEEELERMHDLADNAIDAQDYAAAVPWREREIEILRELARLLR